MAHPTLRRELELESRYALFDELASGGMATVHIGRLSGAVGFARTVAIKRMHPHLSRDAEFVSMFVDEARLAARIRHPNVVATLDVIQVGDGELLLVMEYVHGESLSGLMRAASERGERIAPTIAVGITSGVLFGLHAAHEATDERGVRLEIVHRDVTPANVLVGADGIARVLDFGIATANVRMQTTKEGQMKGKLRYMAPEQLKDEPVTRRTDVYAASMMLWEVLTGERLFAASNEGAIVAKVLEGRVQAPSALMDDVPRALDAVVMKGLSRDPAERFATTREMALALERALPPAPTHAVGDWVERVMGDVLRVRAERIARIESASESSPLQAQRPQYEVTVSHTFTAPDATPAPAPNRTRSLITTAASPVAFANAAVAAKALPPAPVARPLPAAPARSATVRLPALAAPLEETERAQRRRMRRAAGAAMAVSAATTLVVGLVAIVATGRGGASEEATERASAEVAAPPPPSAAVPSAIAQDVSSSNAEPETPHESPSATAPAGPTAPAARAVPPPRSRPSAAPAVKPNCDPPYVEDASGRRRVKRECL